MEIIEIKKIDQHKYFYKWLQSRANIKFLDDIDKVFFQKLGKFFKDNFTMGSYEKNPFLFFINGFSDKHKKIFIMYFMDDINSFDDTKLNDIIQVGDFFYKFRNEFMFRYKTVLGWVKETAEIKLDNMSNKYIDIYDNLDLIDKKKVVCWYNQFYFL